MLPCLPNWNQEFNRYCEFLVFHIRYCYCWWSSNQAVLLSICVGLFIYIPGRASNKEANSWQMAWFNY